MTPLLTRAEHAPKTRFITKKEGNVSTTANKANISIGKPGNVIAYAQHLLSMIKESVKRKSKSQGVLHRISITIESSGPAFISSRLVTQKISIIIKKNIFARVFRFAQQGFSSHMTRKAVC
jgi:hypothetical protein